MSVQLSREVSRQIFSGAIDHSFSDANIDVGRLRIVVHAALAEMRNASADLDAPWKTGPIAERFLVNEIAPLLGIGTTADFDARGPRFVLLAMPTANVRAGTMIFDVELDREFWTKPITIEAEVERAGEAWRWEIVSASGMLLISGEARDLNFNNSMFAIGQSVTLTLQVFKEEK